MARWNINNVSLRGVSLCVPDRIVKTEDFDFFTPEEVNLFNDTVGIKSRYLALDNVCASDLCQAAGEKLLAELGWDKDTIDVLIFESVTGDYKTPPTSCLLQDRMGLPQSCFALDIPMGCCGCMYAITVAANMLSSGNVRRALLLVGDTAVRMGSLKDKSRVPLFGDCGTALALEYNQEASCIDVDFQTMGKGGDALMTPHGGFRFPATLESFVYEDFGNGIVRAPIHTLINGMDVFTFAISRPPKTVAQFMDDLQIDKDRDIDYFLIHQANKMIVDRVVKKLKLDPNKVPYNLEEFGNLGGASLPSLMVSRLGDKLSKGKHTLLMSSFGLGLTWGTMRLETNDLVIPNIVYFK